MSVQEKLKVLPKMNRVQMCRGKVKEHRKSQPVLLTVCRCIFQFFFVVAACFLQKKVGKQRYFISTYCYCAAIFSCSVMREEKSEGMYVSERIPFSLYKLSLELYISLYRIKKT
jgi:hypothetical protein